jgi:AI-2 transport protein TqsA
MSEHRNESDRPGRPDAERRVFPYQKFTAIAIGIILAVVLVIALRALGSILKPFLIAVFFCILIYPVERLLVRIKIPRIVAYLLIFVVTISAGFFLGKLISFNVRAFSDELPVYEETIHTRVERLDEHIRNMEILKEFGVTEEFSLKELVGSGYVSADRLKSVVGKSIGSFFSLLANVLVVLLLMIFILLEAEHFPVRVVYAYGEGRSGKILEVARTIVSDVMKYLTIKTLVAAVTGVVFTGLLGFCGVEFFILWGASACVLHFIPYIGSYLAVLLPAAMVFIQFSPEAAALMLGILVVVQLLLGSYLEPRVMGRELKLSPLFIVMALAFWGWVWGIVGVFLAVPITATIKIVMENFSGTRGIARLMSDVTGRTLKKGKADAPKGRRKRPSTAQA